MAPRISDFNRVEIAVEEVEDDVETLSRKIQNLTDNFSNFQNFAVDEMIKLVEKEFSEKEYSPEFFLCLVIIWLLFSFVWVMHYMRTQNDENFHPLVRAAFVFGGLFCCPIVYILVCIDDKCGNKIFKDQDPKPMLPHPSFEVKQNPIVKQPGSNGISLGELGFISTGNVSFESYLISPSSMF